MSKPRIELVGGPRDGQFVPDLGPVYREPAREEIRLYRPVEAAIAHLDFLSIFDGPRTLEYKMQIDARDGRPRYVFQGER